MENAKLTPLEIIELFTDGVMLAIAIYTAARANRVVRYTPKPKHKRERR
jgi:hypothetical protein